MPRGLPGQALFWGCVGALLVTLSQWPRYAPIPEGQALLLVNLAQPGARQMPCRRLSADELARRAPNMRAPELCPRGRMPVEVRLTLDDAVVLDERIAPGGVAGDGSATLYRRLRVPAGALRVQVRVNDDPRDPARAIERGYTLHLRPRQVVNLDLGPMRALHGGP